jgi:transglutaminase-like putative cysteine protease
MHFHVCHETVYHYAAPVRLGSHTLRLHPRSDNVCILRSSLVVEPAPIERREATDRFGNRVTYVTFAGSTDLLRIKSSFELDTRPIAPLQDPGLPQLPWSWHRQDALAKYRAHDPADIAVRDFAATLAAESAWAALPFLDRLNQALFTRMQHGLRLDGAAQAPAHTLATGRGACRDVAVLFMACCRSLWIAARFVSGYQARGGAPDGRRHMHAWLEVFLPGLGWRGFDPTHGLAVADGHVALCAAPDQADTMPVEGSYIGDSVASRLDYHVRIETA